MRTLAVLAVLPAHAQTLLTSPVFGDQGFREYPVWSGSAAGQIGVLRYDGRLLVAGTGYWGTCNCYRITAALVDTTCGALDPTFGNGGVKDIWFEGRSILHDLTVLDDGRILACGTNAPGNGFSGHKSTIYRLNADGSPDLTFNATGFNKVSFDPISSGAFWRVFPMASGGAVCVGSSSTNINGGQLGIGAMRFLPDGTLDPAFSGDGMEFVNMAALGYGLDFDLGTGVRLADSSLVAIGLVTESGTQRVGMVKFLPTGPIDTGFGTNGVSVSTVIAASDVGTAGLDAAVDMNGRILVSGTGDFTNGEFFMARFLPDGSLDPSYGSGGLSQVMVASNALGRRMELLNDGSTLQFGSENWNNGHPRIVKRLSDGALDTGFGNNGVAAPYGPTYHKVYGGMTLPGGRILAWGLQDQISLFSFTSDPAAEEFLDLGPDVIACLGDSVMLDAGPYAAFLWNTADTLQGIYVDSDGAYDVQVTDAMECHDVDTIQVTFAPPPTMPVITSSNGIDLSTMASGDLQWHLDGTALTGATGADWTAMTNGDYTVTVTDANGCSATSDPFTVMTVGVPGSHIHTALLAPVPTHDRVTLRLPENEQARSVEAIDLLGNMTPLDLPVNGVLDIDRLAAGTYSIRVRTDGALYIGRSVKL
ncbi:MAG: hypothetical protein H6595_04710 [Flavobacteriales bacterium]|nr:hypothetical protein [Flavobacteriales bacterium]MCB9166762.1 hypothetical protein [Flavobacteriales bacterium]